MYFPYLQYGCSLKINTAETAAHLANRCDVCDGPINASIMVQNTCDVLNYQISEDETTISPITYTVPGAADWADAHNPESGRFLGFMVSEVTKPSHVSRSVTPRISGSGGGVLETLRPSAQIFEVEVFLFACDEVAMEYGFRYLMSTLAEGGCDVPCTLCTLEYRDSCPTFTGTPTVAEYNQGRWILRNVGVVSAPEWVDPPVRGLDYFFRKAKFTVASELPWKYECPVACATDVAFTVDTPTLGCGADFDSFFCAPTSVSCSVSEPSLVGESGFIIDITAGSLPLSGIQIQIIPDQFGWVCDPGSAPGGFVPSAPCDLVYIEELPPGYTLRYDTSIEKVIVTSNAGVVYDGTPFLSFDGIGGPPSYPTVRCGEFCVKVVVDQCSVTAGAKASIKSVHREL